MFLCYCLSWKMCLNLPPKRASHWMTFYSVGCTSLYCQLSIVWERHQQKGEKVSQIRKQKMKDKETKNWTESEVKDRGAREIMRKLVCEGHWGFPRCRAAGIKRVAVERRVCQTFRSQVEEMVDYDRYHSNLIHTLPPPAPISSTWDEIGFSLKPKRDIVNSTWFY